VVRQRRALVERQPPADNRADDADDNRQPHQRLSILVPSFPSLHLFPRVCVTEALAGRLVHSCRQEQRPI
jgi:hypothetical protein